MGVVSFLGEARYPSPGSTNFETYITKVQFPEDCPGDIGLHRGNEP
jgi:hypothetical protein